MLNLSSRVGPALIAAALATAPFAAIAQGSQDASAAKALCPIETTDAALVRAFDPEYPEIAREQNLHGMVTVRVDLAPSGDVTGTSIAKSSGNRLLDIAALDSARESAFAPEIRHCAAVAGSYLVTVKFE